MGKPVESEEAHITSGIFGKPVGKSPDVAPEKDTMHVSMNIPHRDVGNGLVMRWSTAEDTERIATLHGLVHRDAAEDPPNITAMRVIRRLMHGDHPFMGSHDFAVIEDTSREGNLVVACTCLW